VPQGVVLGPVLYLKYTSDAATVANFADDAAIMAVGADVEEGTAKLQRSVDNITKWTRQLLIKLNEDKSTHVNFTNTRCHHVPILINGKIIPHSRTAKYLGMTLDAKLPWKVHVKKKLEELSLTHNKCSDFWEGDQPYQRTTNWYSKAGY
jgi:ABC-type dipeptide/oligopeptide/nickel transport system ATPase component